MIKSTISTPVPVLVTYGSGSVARFSSIRSASRSLSGNGSDRLSTTIRRRLKAGGGYLNESMTYVETAA